MKPLTTEEIRAVIRRGELRDNLFKATGIFCLGLALTVIDLCVVAAEFEGDRVLSVQTESPGPTATSATAKP